MNPEDSGIDRFNDRLEVIKNRITSCKVQLTELKSELDTLVETRRTSTWAWKESPILALPPEVLLIIFGIVNQRPRISHLTLLTLCAVCHQWSALIVDTPSVWSLVAIAVNRFLPLHGLEKYLMNSRNEHLDVILFRDDNLEIDYFEASRVAYIIQYLGYAMNRWRSLELRILHFEAARVALTNCRGRADALRDLTISCASFGLHDPDEEIFREWNSGFEAPGLKVLTLAGEALFWIGQANVRWINSIRQLEKLTLADYGMTNEPLISAGHLYRILRFNSIRRSIRIIELKNVHVEPAHMTNQSEAIMDSLRVICITGGCPETASSIIHRLNASNLQRIQVTGTDHTSTSYLQHLRLPFCAHNQCHRYPMLRAMCLTRVRLPLSDLRYLERCEHLTLCEVEDVDDGFMRALSNSRYEYASPGHSNSIPRYYLPNLRSLLIVRCPYFDAKSLCDMIATRRLCVDDVIRPTELTMVSVTGGHSLSAVERQWFEQHVQRFDWA
ncbi:hypothetical protein APHAL10511_003179 [Amanita phalloides]|nr:hypothetical protein APHAL10511_003179 [Amanita phalloides]